MTVPRADLGPDSDRSASLVRGEFSASATLREELTVVLTALWYDIDHNDGASAADFFTPDAELRFEDAQFRGRTEIVEVYRRRAARGPRLSRHVVTNLHLQEVEDDLVRAVSTLVLFAEDGIGPSFKSSPMLVADVWDEFSRGDSAWLISSRWIKNMFMPENEELAVPIE